MTLSFLPEVPKIDPEKGPHLIAGAASPLWLMFGGAAMAGATWWWWSARWREAINIEALMASNLAAPQGALAPIDPVTESPVLAPAALEVITPEVPAPVAAVAEATAEVVAETVQATLDTVEAMTIETQEALDSVSEPVVEAAVEQVEAIGDDLTQLVGVGPKLAAALAELGVTRFADIAAWGPEELAAFDAELNLKGRAERDAWVAQARRLATS